MKSPEETFLVIYVVAGLGIVYEGKQMVLLNEFDERTKYFKTWAIEHDIHAIAKSYKNTHSIAILRLSRKIFVPDNIKEFFVGSTADEAQAYFVEKLGTDQQKKDTLVRLPVESIASCYVEKYI